MPGGGGGGQCLAQKSFPSGVAERKFCFGLLGGLGASPGGHVPSENF